MPYIAGAMIGGAVLGGAGSYFSGQSSARAAERMYRHRYQWQMKDLKKAGLNPMLSMSQGAPVPSMPQTPDVGAGVLSGMNAAGGAAMAWKQNKADLEVKKQQADALYNSSQHSAAQARLTNLDADLKDPQNRYDSSGNPGSSYMYWRLTDAQVARAETEVSKIVQDIHQSAGAYQYERSLDELHRSYLDYKQKRESANARADLIDAEYAEFLGVAGYGIIEALEKVPGLGGVAAALKARKSKGSRTTSHTDSRGRTSHTTESYSNESN